MPKPTEEAVTPKKTPNKPFPLRTRRAASPGDELGKYKTQTSIRNYFGVKLEGQGSTSGLCSNESRKGLIKTPLPARRLLATAEPIVITDDEEMDQSIMDNYHLKTKTISVGTKKRKVSLSRKLHKIKSSEPLAPTNLVEPTAEPSSNTYGGSQLKTPESSSSRSLTLENNEPLYSSSRKRFRKQKLGKLSEISVTSPSEVLTDVEDSENIPQRISPMRKSTVSTTPQKSTPEKNYPYSPKKPPTRGSVIKSVSSVAQIYSTPPKKQPQSSSKPAISHTSQSTRVGIPNSAFLDSQKDQGSSAVPETLKIRVKTEAEIISAAETAGVSAIDWNSPMEEEIKLTSPTKKTAFPTTPLKTTPVKNCTTSGSVVDNSVSSASQIYSTSLKKPPQSSSKAAISHTSPSTLVGISNSDFLDSRKDQGSSAVPETSKIHVKTEAEIISAAETAGVSAIDWNSPMEEEVKLTSPTKKTAFPTTPQKTTPVNNGPYTPTKPTTSGSVVLIAAQSHSTPLKKPPQSPLKATGPSSPTKRSPYKRFKKGSPQKSQLKVDGDAMIGSLVLKHSILECKRYAVKVTNCNSAIKKVIDDYMSLFDREKILLHKLLVRKWAWIRVIDMKYEKIVDNQVSSLNVLRDKGFLEDISPDEPLEVVLSQLKRPELEKLSKKYEETSSGSKKDDLVNRLCKFVNAQRSLGFSSKSLKTTLRDTAFTLLGKCVRIREDTRTILQKIFEASMSPLFLEGQFYTFQQRLSGMEKLMSEVKFEGRKLIPFPLSDFQLFLSPAQFDEFITSVILKFDILTAKDDKNTRVGVQLAKDARASVLIYLSNPVVKEFLKRTPRYIWRYTAGSNYVSALDIGIDFLKRAKEYNDAILAIDVLLAQGEFRKHSRGRWYAEKVMIMDKQLKAPVEEIYPVIIAGLQEDLTPIGRLELSKKAEGIINKKKSGLTQEQKREIRKLMRMPLLSHRMTEIRSTEAPNVSTGNRQMFVEFSACGERTYLNVEQAARNSYMFEFPEGMHDEGSFLKNIILAAFWSVIYIPKENMFVSKYQNAPLDWGTQAFYRNRQQEIRDRILGFREGGIDSVMQAITDVVTVYANHHSLVNWFNICFDMLPTIKNILTCLTLEKFLNLAEYLLESFRERRSGWPDLTLWNTVTGKFKLVEVKSPNDELSFKQIVWLEKFAEIGIDVEECRVNASNKGKKRKAQASNIPSDYSQEVL